MSFSDKLITRFQGYAGKFGVRFPIPSIVKFEGNPSDVPLEEKRSTPMHRAFYENNGPIVHKWRNYMDVYDRHLSRYRGTPVKLLEIGVYRGGSLQMWRNYFGAAATIYGIDIDPACVEYDGHSGSVRIGSQADPVFLKKVVLEMGGIDVIVDDGSHVASHQAITFDTLFPILDGSGVYICEDTMTAYLRGYYEGGFGRATNIIEKMKRVVDDLNLDFHGRPASVPHANRVIRGIHFYQGLIVVEKSPQLAPMHMKIPPETKTT